MAIAVLQAAATTITVGMSNGKIRSCLQTIYKLVMAYLAQANLNLVSATQVVAMRDMYIGTFSKRACTGREEEERAAKRRLLSAPCHALCSRGFLSVLKVR
jgi:hypothetical protein